MLFNKEVKKQFPIGFAPKQDYRLSNTLVRQYCCWHVTVFYETTASYNTMAYTRPFWRLFACPWLPPRLSRTCSLVFDWDFHAQGLESCLKLQEHWGRLPQAEAFKMEKLQLVNYRTYTFMTSLESGLSNTTSTVLLQLYCLCDLFMVTVV